jgi:MFS family permease
MQRPNHILPIIVLSQFAGTSLWFSGNAILTEISKAFQLEKDGLAVVTSSVLIGFIIGTFLYAITAIADRFKPSLVFFISSLLAAAANLLILLPQQDFFLLVLSRFFVGFFLAGIYPVGMKIAAEWYEKGLGKALGYLVGALVLGTAFPHLLKQTDWNYNWKHVLMVTSIVAATGGLIIRLFVPRGPFFKKSNSYSFAAFKNSFRLPDFRAASFGYFGHMWELYAFWAFVPIILNLYSKQNGALLNVPLWSFIIIAAGAVGCVAGGYITLKKGSAKVAYAGMFVSLCCCLLAAFCFVLPPALFLFFLLIWGFAVVADSPQFSSIVAQTAVAENKGSALTIITCIGFSITVASIYVLNRLFEHWMQSPYALLILAPGPLFGLWKLRPLLKVKAFN